MIRMFEICESILGLLAAFVLGLAAPVGGLIFGLSLLADRTWPAGVAVLLVTAPACWSSGTVIRLAGNWERDVLRQRRERPSDFGPEQIDWRFEEPEELSERDRQTLIGYMASSLPDFAWPFRVWCALYWLMLVGAAAWLGHELCRGAAHAVNANSTVLFVLACAGHLAFLVAANLYLVLSTAVLMPSSNDWLLLYRARFILDAAALMVSVAAVFAF